MSLLKSKRSKAGNVVLLIGLVLIMGSSTSASNALSQSSFTTSNGKKTFTKNLGFAHFQDNNKNGKPVNGEDGKSSNGHRDPADSNGYSNGKNGHNGKSKENGVAFLPRNGGKREADRIVDAEFVAETKLPTDVGQFQLRAYRVRNCADDEAITDGEPEFYQNTNALEPVVIYSTDKPPFGEDGRLAENVPIRIHDQCLTSEVFRSRRYVAFAGMCHSLSRIDLLAACATGSSF
jgi:hypothetical protein